MDCSLTWISTCKNESTGINKQRQPHQVDTETVAKNHQRLRSAQLDPPIAGALISSNLRLSSYSLIIIFFTFYLTPSKHRVCSLCSGQIALYSVNKAFRLPCLSPEWNTNDLSKWYSCSPQKPIAFIMEALWTTWYEIPISEALIIRSVWGWHSVCVCVCGCVGAGIHVHWGQCMSADEKVLLISVLKFQSDKINHKYNSSVHYLVQENILVSLALLSCWSVHYIIEQSSTLYYLIMHAWVICYCSCF